MGKDSGAAIGKAASSSGGYWTSAIVFAAITALWAYVVRSDPYYRFIELFGVRLPAATIAYLATMPALGFLLGRWRFADAARRGGMSFGAKTLARAVQFLYSHSLLALFTIAMMTDYFLGLNIDDQVRSLDDRLFDLAARFAPWLSAYLFGFNLGRATVSGGASLAPSPAGALKTSARSEPVFSLDGADAEDEPPLGAERPEAETPRLASTSGVGLDGEAERPLADESGFLPPQDYSALRPRLNELR